MPLKTRPWIRLVLKKCPVSNTYLHLAAKHNQIDMFEVILNGGCDANLLNDEGYTPFHVACLHGRLIIAEFLMKKSAELNIDLSRKTTDNETAYHLACSNISNDKMTKWITKNSDELKINLNEKPKPRDLISIFADDKYMQEFFRCRARMAERNIKY
jgi:ankyrin repeat protein